MDVKVMKSKQFAIRIVKLYRYLVEHKREYILSKQLLRSGTSVGANLREASKAQSTADFIAKCSIALKEADETCYWLELLHETDYLSDNEFVSVYTEAEELVRILTSVVKSSKGKNF